MRSTTIIAACAGPFILACACAHAQEVPRDQYITYVPLHHPHLVQQTDASAALHLYGDRGDPAYRDESPVDGIDDGRHRILMSLAVRFAPYLVQNTENIPVNFDVYIGNAERFCLHVDTWDVTEEISSLARRECIDFSALDGGWGTAPADSSEDRKLADLLERFSMQPPLEGLAGQPIVRERPELFSVLFFDLPGEGPKSWKDAYLREYERTPERMRKSFPYSYVHPFLAEAGGGEGTAPGYELVMQYWFYYPSNDGGNNHEGDWEHINVVIAPMSMVGGPLSAGTIEGILTGALPATGDAPDPLVIGRVEYYFHHFVMTLDFSSPNVYLPRAEWKAEVESRTAERLQEKEIWKDIRYMAYADDEETTVNTHPFGYIGADNKGLDQALSAPGGRNRDSHGTFPFPGRYHDIGPAGATEQVSVSVDPRRHLGRLKAGERTAGPEFRRGKVLGLADPDRLRIVPDWERIIERTRSDPRARRDWSWLILPIRWGYPATRSPFSGILPHADTGNLAPHGPSFSSGWNATGSTPGFHAYEPHMLPAVFPLGLQDSFRNDLGFLNLTLPVLFNLPPLDFLTRIATYPFKLAFGRRDPVFYPRQGVPFRFFGLSSGVSTQIFHDDFSALAINPEQLDEFVGRFLAHIIASGADTSTAVIGGADLKENSVGPFYQIAFYIGGRFTSENTVRNMRASFGVEVEFNNIPDYVYMADLNYWEYAGSIRYSISRSRLQPFVKAGYGWSWYRLENVRASGVPFDTAESEWIEPKSIWPNVWHFGLGLEYVPWKRVGVFPGGGELALRIEYGRYYQDLGLDLSDVPLGKLDFLFETLGDVPGSEQVTRDDFVFGVTLSF